MATAPPRADAQLLERLRVRDPAAWEELYRLYEGRLYGFAYRLTGNPHDAADLVQETFVRALPRLDRLSPERADVAAYLFATAKNLFLKSAERAKRQRPTDEVPEPDEPTPLEDDPQGAALLVRQQEEVRLANARLDPRQRLVLALRELEDRSYAEIGELVGLNENAVAQLVFRARQRLREELRLAQVDRSRLPESCQRLLPDLSALLDGQLKGERRAGVVAHLEDCSACQTALAEMEEARRRYRSLVPPLVGLVALKDKIDDALGASGYWSRPPGLGARLAARVAPHGRAALLAGLGLVVLGGLGGGLAAIVTGAESLPPTSPAPQVAVQTTEVPTATPPPFSPSETDTVAASTTEPMPASTAPETETQAEDAAGAATDQPETATDGADAPSAVSDPAAPPPPPAILDAPDDPTASRTAVFRFAAPGATSYLCSLDGGSPVPCSSPWDYTALGPGRHAFSVRARNAAGTGAAAIHTWTVSGGGAPLPPTTAEPSDTVPPTVSLVATPAPRTSETSATFAFTASEPATFACSLDGGAFSPCQSPRTVSGLSLGSHMFAVQATDEAGNTGQPATFAWTVTRPPLPDLVVSALQPGSVTVANVGDAPAGPFVVSVDVDGVTFSISGLAPGASVTRTLTGCVEGSITAVADSGGQVAESDEGNNARTVPGAIC